MQVIMFQNNTDEMTTRSVRRDEEGHIYVTFERGDVLATEVRVTVVMTQAQLDYLAAAITNLPVVIKPEPERCETGPYEINEQVYWYDAGSEMAGRVIGRSEDKLSYTVRLNGSVLTFSKGIDELWSDVPF